MGIFGTKVKAVQPSEDINNAKKEKNTKNIKGRLLLTEGGSNGDELKKSQGENTRHAFGN